MGERKRERKRKVGGRERDSEGRRELQERTKKE